MNAPVPIERAVRRWVLSRFHACAQAVVVLRREAAAMVARDTYRGTNRETLADHANELDAAADLLEALNQPGDERRELLGRLIPTPSQVNEDSAHNDSSARNDAMSLERERISELESDLELAVLRQQSMVNEVAGLYPAIVALDRGVDDPKRDAYLKIDDTIDRAKHGDLGSQHSVSGVCVRCARLEDRVRNREERIEKERKRALELLRKIGRIEAELRFTQHAAETSSTAYKKAVEEVSSLGDAVDELEAQSGIDAIREVVGRAHRGELGR